MSLNGTVWVPIGPSPINQGSITANGQVTAIAVHPNNANIIYIGTAWGGVWLTQDGGTTWTPIFDRARVGIGEPAGIAIDPVDPSIMYVGTSNRDGSQFSGRRHSRRPGCSNRRMPAGAGSGSVPGFLRVRRAMPTSSSARSLTLSSSIRQTIKSCISRPTSACSFPPMAG